MNTYIGYGTINNSLIKIGEEMKFFDLTGNLPLAQYFYKHEQSLKMEVWYESIYEDKWKLTYEKGKATYEEVDTNFSLPDEEQFEN